MITITIIIKGIERDVILAYNTDAEVQQAEDALATGEVEDAFGQTLICKPSDILCHVITDLDKQWKYRTELALIKLRSERDFNMAIEKDPSLRFMSGNVNFGASK